MQSTALTVDHSLHLWAIKMLLDLPIVHLLICGSTKPINIQAGSSVQPRRQPPLFPQIFTLYLTLKSTCLLLHGWQLMYAMWDSAENAVCCTGFGWSAKRACRQVSGTVRVGVQSVSCSRRSRYLMFPCNPAQAQQSSPLAYLEQ